MDEEQRSVEMQHLVAEVFELAGALRRDGERIAKLAGQTQARWQVMWIAATGRFSVAMIARRLGITRQSVQRVADEIVAEGLANFEPNPDHQRSPLLILTDTGQTVLDTINAQVSQTHARQVKILGEDGVIQLRDLLARYRNALRDHPHPSTNRRHSHKASGISPDANSGPETSSPLHAPTKPQPIARDSAI
jgi:DNA-binding MarR family transcriptional regulator